MALDIGVVHYVIRPEGNIIDAVWHTTRVDFERPGTGIARGDTSNGFPGRYEITYYYPNGEISAELDLVIEKSGDIYHLSYLKDGALLLQGVAIETPSGLSGGYRRLDQA